MKNIKQYRVIHNVYRCPQVKQNECSHLSPVDRTNDIIHDTDYSSRCAVLSVNWFDGNTLWRPACAVNRIATTHSTNFGCKTWVRYWPIWVCIHRIQCSLFESRKNKSWLCVPERTPDCKDVMQIVLSTWARTSEACFMSQVATGSNEQCLRAIDADRLEAVKQRRNWLCSSQLVACTKLKHESSPQDDGFFLLKPSILVIPQSSSDTDDLAWSVKKAAKSSVEKLLEFWCDDGDIWVRSFNQRAFELPLLIIEVQ